jgi:hypothetical protein
MLLLTTAFALPFSNIFFILQDRGRKKQVAFTSLQVRTESLATGMCMFCQECNVKMMAGCTTNLWVTH